MFAKLSHSLVAFALFAILNAISGSALAAIQTPPRSPSETVREFYKAMREKRFREAFALSIYKPAIENLKPQEFEDVMAFLKSLK